MDKQTESISNKPAELTTDGQGFSRYLSIAAVIILIASVIGLFYQPQLSDGLSYDRSQFAKQSFTALSHALLHLNMQHLILNIVGLLCIYILFNGAFISLWWLFALATSAVVSAYGMYYYSPETANCVGLSGALHGLFIYAVLRSRASVFWLVAIAVKLIVEQTGILPASVLTERFIANPVIVDAHLWGAAGGFLFYGIVRSINMMMVIAELNRE